ncbi:hypothetical protein AALP_AA3G296200 [Arabis alpina]|uniref:Uncharacterized protein n=1 Tax=Arabis alpina TaxID=50452 RepID=A0A087HCJ7_ARAAL|nr:hypothetical protein AALP_AA3G296200 [Arabis alpina]
MAPISRRAIFLVFTLVIALYVSISDAREAKMQETKTDVYISDAREAKMQETKTDVAFKGDINQFGRCEKDEDCKCYPSCLFRRCSIRHTCECTLC